MQSIYIFLILAVVAGTLYGWWYWKKRNKVCVENIAKFLRKKGLATDYLTGNNNVGFILNGNKWFVRLNNGFCSLNVGFTLDDSLDWFALLQANNEVMSRCWLIKIVLHTPPESKEPEKQAKQEEKEYLLEYTCECYPSSQKDFERFYEKAIYIMMEELNRHNQIYHWFRGKSTFKKEKVKDRSIGFRTGVAKEEKEPQIAKKEEKTEEKTEEKPVVVEKVCSTPLSYENNLYSKFYIIFGYTSGTDYEADVDFSAFMLNSDSILPQQEFFVFYNTVKSLDGSLRYIEDDYIDDDRIEGCSEGIIVDLSNVDERIVEIVFTASLYEATQERFNKIKDVCNFGHMKNLYIGLYEYDEKAGLGTEILRYDIQNKFTFETALEICRLVKRGNNWIFEAMENGYEGGLIALANKYYDESKN